MGKRCGNCDNGKWLNQKDAVPDVCLKCEYVFGEPSNWVEKTQTNADRIRAMSDEELSKMLGAFCSIAEGCDGCPFEKECPPFANDRGGWLNWLQQPAEVE